MSSFGQDIDSSAERNPSPPTIPDMDLLRRIGRGGFGDVWLARNQTTGGLRAVKVVQLRCTGSVDPAGREIISLCRLEATVGIQHPNLVTIYHVGTTADYLFYIMDPADDISGSPVLCTPEYVPATLTVRLGRGPLATDECVRRVRQLLSALACLYQQGLVHRDVKPSNCLFIGGELKLADFGLLTEAERTVSRVGTVGYMPPDGIMDMQADVYAAGLVIYEMITGLPVNRFPALQSQAKAVLADGRLAALNRLVIQSCDPDRDNRFPDASAMLKELERLLAGDARVGRSNTGPAARRERFRMCVLVPLSFMASTLAVLGFLLWGLARSARVDVNFITDRFDATIWLDDQIVLNAEGTPYTTPCTIPRLSTEVHKVVFKYPGLTDLEVGRIDFSITREIVAHWADEDEH